MPDAFSYGRYTFCMNSGMLVWFLYFLVKGIKQKQQIERDTIWPSRESAEHIVKRLKEKNFSYPYKHVCYEHMSHMMLEYCGAEIKYFIKSERKYPEECAGERKEMEKECVEWIENV